MAMAWYLNSVTKFYLQKTDKKLVERQFKMAITWKLTFPPADSQWAIFEKSTKII